MDKKIKRLLEKETLTGDDVGRIMVLDFLIAYKNISMAGEGTGFLSNDQKIRIVDSLTDPYDISKYNDFRGIHDYLTSVSTVYEGFSKAFDIYILKLYGILINMHNAEEERRFSESLPVIMTKRQYEDFLLSGSPEPHFGIAVLQCEHIENDYCPKDYPKWRDMYSAENIIKNESDSIREYLTGINDALCECIARQKALELVGRYIRVNSVKILISPVDVNRVIALNDFMENTVKAISRPGSSKDCEERIKSDLRSVLSPIDVSALIPEPKAVLKARRYLNFAVIKNESEAFVSMLKREWRNENPK